MPHFDTAHNCLGRVRLGDAAKYNCPLPTDNIAVSADEDGGNAPAGAEGARDRYAGQFAVGQMDVEQGEIGATILGELQGIVP